MIRHPDNPIVSRHDIRGHGPHLRDVSSVFNPGAVRHGDDYLLMLRVQNRGRETHLVMAESKDGARFAVRSEAVEFRGIDDVAGKVYHVYDPRITCVEGTYYVLFAMDMDGGCQLGLGRTTDFESFDFMGMVSDGPMRNGVLFPERVGGSYLRLDRPNDGPVDEGGLERDTICLSTSSDLLHWARVGNVAHGRLAYWDELIGPGPPPIKTREGWLLVYHGIARHFQPIYQAGVMLLDLEEPLTVLARGRYNVLEPREEYEMLGQVPNVVFPTGMIAEAADGDGFAEMDSPVKLYYGAADTVVGLATSTVRDLVAACRA